MFITQQESLFGSGLCAKSASYPRDRIDFGIGIHFGILFLLTEAFASVSTGVFLFLFLCAVTTMFSGIVFVASYTLNVEHVVLTFSSWHSRHFGFRLTSGCFMHSVVLTFSLGHSRHFGFRLASGCFMHPVVLTTLGWASLYPRLEFRFFFFLLT